MGSEENRCLSPLVVTERMAEKEDHHVVVRTDRTERLLGDCIVNTAQNILEQNYNRIIFYSS